VLAIEPFRSRGATAAAELYGSGAIGAIQFDAVEAGGGHLVRCVCFGIIQGGWGTRQGAP